MSSKRELGGGGVVSIHESSARVAVAEATKEEEGEVRFQATGGAGNGSSSAKPRRVTGARKAAGIFF